MHSRHFFWVKSIPRLFLKCENLRSHMISYQSLLLSTTVLNDTYCTVALFRYKKLGFLGIKRIVLSHQNRSPPKLIPLDRFWQKMPKVVPPDQFWQPKMVPSCQNWSPLGDQIWQTYACQNRSPKQN